MKAFGFIVMIILSLCHAEAQSFTAVVQKGHGEVVKSLQLSSDGQYLYTGSRDKSAKLWSVARGLEVRTYLGHSGTVNDLSTTQNYLATSSSDGTVRVWDMASGKEVWQHTYPRAVTSVVCSPAGHWLAVGGYADSVEIYDTRTFSLLKKIKTHSELGLGYGVSLTFSPDGSLLAIGEDNRTAKLYDTQSWNMTQEFKPSLGSCGGCATYTAFNPDGTQLLKFSNGAPFVVFQLPDGNPVHSFRDDFDDIASVDYHSNGENYLLATEDTLFLFDSSHKLIRSVTSLGAIEDAIFHPENREIYLATGKKVVVLSYEGAITRTFEGVLNQTTTGLNYDIGSYWEHYIAKWLKYKSARMLTNEAIYIGKTGEKARSWSTSSALIQMEYIGHESGVITFEDLSEDHLVTGGGDGKIIIWDKKTGKVRKRIEAHREPVFDLALSHDKKTLASGSWDGTICLWDTETWERIGYSYHEGASPYSLAFSSNDAYLVTALLDKSLRLYEPKTGKFVREYIGHTAPVTHIHIRANEMFTTSWDGQLIIWDFASGLIKQRHSFKTPLYDLSVRDNEVVVATADRNLYVYSLTESRVIHTLEGHQAAVNGVQLVNGLLMTADVDGVTKFWDYETKKELYDHIQIGERDWMIKTPQGFFDGTDQAIAHIHFVNGNQVYRAEQFMDQFYVPGLVAQLFKGDAKKDRSMGFLLNQSPPPVLKLSGLVEQDVAKLYLKVEDKGGGIEGIRLFHNGRRVSLEPQIQKVRSDQHQKIYTIEFPLVAGTNEFSAIAFSEAQLESNQATVSLYSESKVPGSTCHILTVGINEYDNPALNLNYARPDAHSFANQLAIQGKEIFADIVMHQIYDREASRDQILRKLKELQVEVSANDVFVFYFAGHGSMIDDEFYLVSTTASRLYDGDKMNQYGISARQLQESLLGISALKQLIVMDACQSGAGGEKLVQRGIPEEKAISQLSRSAGIHVLAAAGSDQYATEFESLGHGLFTYTLLSGLAGEADGAPKDGKVTINELKSYLDDQVPELSILHKGSPQYPHTFSRGQDFPIVVIEE